MQNFNQTGINYIKIALTSSTDLINVLKDLPNLRQLDAKIIAVFFADYGVNITLIEYLSRAGFSGVMLDTAKKKFVSIWKDKILPLTLIVIWVTVVVATLMMMV